MNIEISAITGEQRDAILKMDEGHFSDLKAIEITPAKLTKYISSFANASGGELYIGIDEIDFMAVKKRSWRGFSNPEAANGHIQIFEKLFPLGQFFSYTFIQCDGSVGLVLQVEVRKTREIVTASDGIAYVRRGAQSLPCNDSESIKRLELDKGVTSFEGNTVNTDVSNITNSIPILEFLTNVIPSAEPKPWLTKQNLIIGGKPTVAGILLFAEEPQAVLPKRCAIKIYRYKTKEKSGTRETLDFDPITIEGCLYDQIKSAVDRTVGLIQGIQKLGPKGLEEVTYPRETLHEILTNAILHRDYSYPADVQIRIFDNRIEIESPGRLPGHITKDNILREQFARNGAIVRLIHKYPNPPNKDVGEGLNTAFDAMKKLRLKPPDIEERDYSVIIHIRHEPLASPEESIMEYLGSHQEIQNRDARELTGIASENAVKRVFQKMQESGLIEPVPDKKSSASAWRKQKNPSSNNQ